MSLAKVDGDEVLEVFCRPAAQGGQGGGLERILVICTLGGSSGEKAMTEFQGCLRWLSSGSSR